MYVFLGFELKFTKITLAKHFPKVYITVKLHTREYEKIRQMMLDNKNVQYTSVIFQALF